MEQVVKRRFHGRYPARKSFQTEFAHPGGLYFQVDAIAYRTDPEKDRADTCTTTSF